jgi:hypothetical protein
MEEADGVIFDAGSVAAEPIREHQSYAGVRIAIRANVDRARVRVQVDTGFGDAVEPPAQRVTYPSLLDAPAPIVLAYPREVVIAEKFQAMVDLGAANSRMKDYFDVDALSRRHPFEGSELARALEATFRRRRTSLPTSVPAGLSDAFAADPARRAQWAAFVSRLRLERDPATASLAEVVARIRGFLLPVSGALAAARPWTGTWQPGGPWTPA